FARKSQAFLLKPDEQESVDPRAGAIAAARSRHRRLRQSAEGPELSILVADRRDGWTIRGGNSQRTPQHGREHDTGLRGSPGGGHRESETTQDVSLRIP